VKELLITSGYPRSGSTYLNHALHLFYYPDEEINQNRHTVIAIEKAERIIVPFRHPVDAIASWNVYPLPSKLEDDIKFYLRFHNAVINNVDKIILFDFDLFTRDVNYIKTQIADKLQLETNKVITDAIVKQLMLQNKKELNLPRDNQLTLLEVKKELETLSQYEECVNIFTKLKEKQ